MLKTLQDLLQRLSGADTITTPAQLAHDLHLSTAVLLVEVMRAESTLAPSERLAVLEALKNRFDLSEADLQALLALAHDTAQTAYDYQRFTSLLNEHFSQAQKIQLVQEMWQVAYADAHLDAHENHVIAKVAGLLHVTHSEYIGAKLWAKEAGPAV